ncbi:hypothetical protein BH11PSE3_BH11PSE3_36340 [soil metagenome]
MTHRLILGVTLLVASALPAAAQTTPPAAQSASRPLYAFTGQSRATLQLKRDVMVAIAGYSQQRYACKTIKTVETAPLQQGYEPKTAMFRVAEPQHFYERWTADVCGTKRPFLVALWPSPQGGADYKVVEVPPGTEP